MVIRLPRAAFEIMAAHARAAYPEECCGLLLARPEAPGALSGAVPCKNLQNQYHARFPEEYPRDATNAYLLDPRELARTEEAALGRGERLAGIFHSHPEVGAYFSAEDKLVALMGGDEPAFADFLHIVVDARRDPSGAVIVPLAKAFAWNGTARDFEEVTLEIHE